MKYVVLAFVGDFHCSHQPYWDTTFTALYKATTAAIDTYHKLTKYKTDPKFLVLVARATDELVDHPLFVIGNGAAARAALRVTEEWQDDPDEKGR